MKNTLSLLILLCSFVTSMAQSSTVQDSTVKKDLDEVMVTATKFLENKKYIAQQVQSFNKKIIEKYNQQTTAELLTHTGAVQVQKSQLGGGSPIIRGFEANKVLITVDGVRMNNAIFRGGHLQNVITLDNSVVSKLEILFGPSSVVYGSDALGGVLNFTTINPALSANDKILTKANGFVRYSSAYFEKTGHADFSIAGKKFGSISAVTVSDFGDLRQGGNYNDKFPNWGKRTFYVERINGTDSAITNKKVSRQVQSGYKQYDFLQKFLYRTKGYTHTLNFQYSTSSNIFRYDRLTETNAAGTPRSAEWYYGPQNRFFSAYQLSLPATKIFDKSQIVVGYQDIEESRINRNFKSSRRNSRTENVKIATFNADFFKKMKLLEIGYGTEITSNKVKSNAFVENIATAVRAPLDTRYPDGGSSTQSYAAYVTGLYKIRPSLIANLGFRFTKNRLFSKFIDKTFFPFPFNEIEQQSSRLNGNASLVWLAGKGWKISGLLATGFRTPNVDDVAKVFESNNNSIITPNPSVKAEQTLNYEIGITKTWNNKVEWNTTAWYTNFTDILTTKFSQFNGQDSIVYNGNKVRVATLTNGAKAFIYGFNTSLKALLTKSILFTTQYTYTYGRLKEEPADYPLDHITPAYGKTSVTYTAACWNVELFSLYNAAKKSKNYNLRGEDNQVYSADPVSGFTPWWITANIRSGYDFTKSLRLQLAVENIFDKFYRVFASGLSAPGRNLSVTLRAGL